MTRISGGVTTTYMWDDHDRLASITTSDGSKKQSHTFGVNGFRRKKKDKNDVETTEYAAGLATAVSKAQGGDTITYLMGHRIMGFEKSGNFYWLVTDSLSTVRDVVNSSGSVVASYEFSEYGQRIATSESGVSSQKTFVGGLSVQDEVADTGLMLMGHRFYDPSGPAGGTGRFLNRDPIGFAGGLNLFAYAGNAPASRVDPSGLDSFVDVVVGSVETGLGTFIAAEPSPAGEFLIFDGTRRVRRGLAELGFTAFIATIFSSAASGGGSSMDPTRDFATDINTAMREGLERERQQTRATDRSGRCEPDSRYLYRDGRDWESQQRLSAKAWEGLNSPLLGLHGVSASVIPSINASVAERSILERHGFKVVWTPDPFGINHYTILLPNPVTEEVTRTFNQDFNRVKGNRGRGGMR